MKRTIHPGIPLLESFAYTESQRYTRRENVERLLEIFGNPQDAIKTIHVGGTNGKGSVSSMLASMLLASGKTVGQFSSPHLTRVTERCLINSKEVEEELFGNTILRVIETSKKESIEIGYFSIGAIASFLIFRELGLDWGVIEVGLGGTYDATNVIKQPEVTVITSIGYDHEDVLGTSLEEIAMNKAGIFKQNVAAFVGNVPAEATSVFERHAKNIGTELKLSGRDYRLENEGNRSVSFVEHKFSLSPFSSILKAEYQFQNAALAVSVALHFGISKEDISKGLSSFSWPGRVEEFNVRDKRVIIDAAHNPQGMEAFLDFLSNEISTNNIQHLIFIIGILKRKNWQNIINCVNFFKEKIQIQGIKIDFIISPIDQHHVIDIEGISLALEDGSTKIFKGENPGDSLDKALHLAETADKNCLIVVSGSIYLLGAIRQLLLE